MSQAKVQISHDTILIGEQFELLLSLKGEDAVSSADWPNLPDKINGMEVLLRGKLDSVRNGTRVEYRQAITMTSFDSGKHVIPGLTFTIGGVTFRTDPVALVVKTVPLEGEEYHDIRDIMEVPNNAWNWLELLGIVLFLMLLFLLLRWYVRRRRSRQRQFVPKQHSVHPYDVALLALDQLRKDEAYKRGEMKKYYSGLYDIFREYLSAAWGFSLLHVTTDDLLIRVKGYLRPEDLSRLGESLRIADAVKYAKYPSDFSEAEQSWESIRGAIMQIDNQSSRR